MIELQNLTKTFQSNGKTVSAVNDVSLTVNEGEICVFLGPSGCGKSTTLKMINRLIKPTSGKILINGEDTTDLDEVTLRRNIGYVIQQIGLFPNMTIEENIVVVPKLLGWDKQKCHDRARELMSMIKLEPKQYLHRYPRELSGGQQQRIGVIRALAADAPLLLMDEPFGAVDPINREMIQNEFFEMQRALNKTVIMVSHDIDEAIKLGDKIAIFRAGKLLQIDHPGHVAGTSGRRVRQQLRGPGQHPQAPAAGQGRRRGGQRSVGKPGNSGGRSPGVDGRTGPSLCGGNLRREQGTGLCAPSRPASSDRHLRPIPARVQRYRSVRRALAHPVVAHVRVQPLVVAGDGCRAGVPG
ncbi:ABC-type proline/glycine betaine transport system ATPase subunit [Pseudomonas rhodesiae]|nr:ABC-type proline/glycine betaine transport system ATPase subunit [Pseudomonas rhodesiae]